MANKKKTTKKTTKQSKKPAAEPKAAPQRRRSPGEAPKAAGNGFLDSSAKRDLVGVCLIIVGIALMIVVCMPTSDAFLNGALSTGLHFVLGIGSYVLPIFLAFLGISYIYKSKQPKMSARIAIGLAIVFVALLGFFALFAPVQSAGTDNVDDLFTDDILVNYGGYIGSAITWACISLMGRAVTGVILAGIAIVGLIIVGFSLSRSIEVARFKKEAAEPLAPKRHREQSSGFARVRVADDRDIDVDDIYRQMRGVGTSENFDPNRTAVFGENAQEYLELPEPEFLQNLYPEYGEEEVNKTGRLHPSEVPPSYTRRLAPLSNDAYFNENSLGDRQSFANDAYSNESSFGNGPIESDWGEVYANSPYLNSEIDDEAEDLADLPEEYQQSEYLDGSYYGDINYLNGRTASYYDDINARKELDLDKDYSSNYDDDLEYSVPAVGAIAAPTPYDDDVSEEPQIRDIYIDGTKTLSVHIDDDANSIRIPTLEPVVIDAPIEHESSSPETEVEPIISAINPAPIKKKTASKADKTLSKPAKTYNPSKFRLPSMSLLRKAPKSKKRSGKELSAVAATLQQALSNFGVDAEVVSWIAGPTVTLFEVNLPAGVRVNKVTALNDDIALALAAPGIRIFAPVPGTNYVGIEVPNAQRETVYLSDVLGNAEEGPLQIAIGKDVEGHSIISDLAKMPHLLIGGTTGSGKSVAINAMIMSILMRATPEEVRFILIDPKRVEFTPYNGIPHLYVPVVTEPKEAASALSWGVAEMERRLKVFSAVGARNITQYNAKALKNNEELENSASSDNPEEEESPMEIMPYIVIVIDELADLMMNVGKEVEISISRIAQLARAAGIHLIVATQRPSTNVVTGLIKANITNRIAFNVASSIDSRVILDSTGAENLIGLGDLLLSKPELAKPQRIQACFVSESEIESVVNHVKAQGSPEYHSEILNTNTYSIGDTNPQGGASSNLDPLVWEAAGIIVSSGMGSTSNLQRRLKVGYARAGRIMDQIEELGIVGPSNGSKPREVLVDEAELEMIKDLEQADE